MCDHHYLIDSQLINRNQQASHRRIVRSRHQRPRVLDDLRVAVLEPQRLLQQHGKPRVHAAQHRQLAVRILVCQMRLIRLRLHEFSVVADYLIDCGHSSECFLKDTNSARELKAFRANEGLPAIDSPLTLPPSGHSQVSGHYTPMEPKTNAPAAELQGHYQRCVAELNHCDRFCRPAPNHSANAPWECKDTANNLISKMAAGILSMRE